MGYNIATQSAIFALSYLNYTTNLSCDGVSIAHRKHILPTKLTHYPKLLNCHLNYQNNQNSYLIILF